MLNLAGFAYRHHFYVRSSLKAASQTAVMLLTGYDRGRAGVREQHCALTTFN